MSTFIQIVMLTMLGLVLVGVAVLVTLHGRRRPEPHAASRSGEAVAEWISRPGWFDHVQAAVTCQVDLDRAAHRAAVDWAQDWQSGRLSRGALRSLCDAILAAVVGEIGELAVAESEREPVVHSVGKQVIEIGSNKPIVIDKLFGPTLFRPLRITALVGGPLELSGGETIIEGGHIDPVILSDEEPKWVIEQQVSRHPYGQEQIWLEVARVDAINAHDRSEVPDETP